MIIQNDSQMAPKKYFPGYGVFHKNIWYRFTYIRDLWFLAGTLNIELYITLPSSQYKKIMFNRNDCQNIQKKITFSSKKTRFRKYRPTPTSSQGPSITLQSLRIKLYELLWAPQMATMMKTHCEITLTWPNDKLRLLFQSNAARTARGCIAATE